MFDGGHLASDTSVTARTQQHEPVHWKCKWQVAKFRGDDTSAEPYEVIEREGNALMYGGASALWHMLTGGVFLAPFDAVNARLGVGDSTAAENRAHTDLQATTNKLRKSMDSTYPQHTDGLVAGSAAVAFRATFSTAEANFAWNEWAIFNGATDGRMLNRRVESLGTKSNAASWVLTVTLSLS